MAGILDFIGQGRHGQRLDKIGLGLSAFGQTLSDLSMGRPADLSNIREEAQRMQRMGRLRDKLPGILPNATPQQQGILAEMLGMGGRPAGAAMQGILGQVFPEPQSMTDFQRIYGMLPEDKRDDFVQIEAGLQPRAQAADQAPSIIREAQALFPNDPAAQRRYVTDYRQKSGVTVNTGNSAPQVGTIPQGFQLMQGPDGAWQMAPIPGGPAAQDVAKTEKAQQAAETQTDRYGGVVLEDIGRAREMVESSPLFTTGIGGAVLQNVPGTNAFDVNALVDTVRANVGLDRLQQLREASPTGGALGNVTERENALLQSTLGNLAQAQSGEQFLHNLDRLEDIYLGIVNGPFTEKKRIAGRTFIKVGADWYQVGG